MSNASQTIVIINETHDAELLFRLDYSLVPDIYVSKLHFQEKFRKLEKRDKTAEEDDGFSSKKIHVRSKDPSKIARQFEKSEKGRNGTRPGPKVIFPSKSYIHHHL